MLLKVSLSGKKNYCCDKNLDVYSKVQIKPAWYRGSLSLTKVNKSLLMAIMHECVSDALNFSEASEPTFEGLLN